MIFHFIHFTHFSSQVIATGYKKLPRFVVDVAKKGVRPAKVKYCNISLYFKSIEQTITFKLCLFSQFKCYSLHDSFEML